MVSMRPNAPSVKAQLPEHQFKRSGIRIHRDLSAPAIGGSTPSQQMQQASKIAIQNDPIIEGALPQNRIGRYMDIDLPDQT